MLLYPSNSAMALKPHRMLHSPWLMSELQQENGRKPATGKRGSHLCVALRVPRLQHLGQLSTAGTSTFGTWFREWMKYLRTCNSYVLNKPVQSRNSNLKENVNHIKLVFRKNYMRNVCLLKFGLKMLEYV